MIRILDFIFSLVSLVVVFPLCLFVIIIGWFDTGSPLFFQKRIGINLKSFNLLKFRTMKIGTLSLGTHLIDPSNITYFGSFLRKFKLDELPQLWNVLIGDMSLVGPRPCLFNQRKLISERKKLGIFKVRPGITGLPQVTGITMATPTLLAQTDLKMIKQMNLCYYFYYITITFLLIFKKKL
jgi:lipopolysaccharide/colanic/teichoic acid biosynthesis glycosyltransferase